VFNNGRTNGGSVRAVRGGLRSINFDSFVTITDSGRTGAHHERQAAEVK